jgi:hypothetical protein
MVDLKYAFGTNTLLFNTVDMQEINSLHDTLINNLTHQSHELAFVRVLTAYVAWLEYFF